jgi:hypothetical protein
MAEMLIIVFWTATPCGLVGALEMTWHHNSEDHDQHFTLKTEAICSSETLVSSSRQQI